MRENKQVRSQICTFLFWLGFIAVFGVSPRAGAAEPGAAHVLLAVVNSDSIFSSDVDAIFANLHTAMKAEERGKFDHHKLVSKLVNDRLLIQEAISLGIDSDEHFVEILEQQRQKLVTAKYVQSNFRRDDSVNEASLQEYFKANYHKIKVRTLSVETELAADSMLALILQGSSMDSLAKARSLDVNRYQGGAQSAKYWANFEGELRVHAIDPIVGKIYGPFPYGRVFALMRIEEMTPANMSELSAVREHIAGVIRAQNAEQARLKFLSDLRHKYNVTVDSAAITVIAQTAASALDSSFQRGSDRPVATLLGETILTDSALRQKTAHAAMMNALAAVDTLLYQTLDGLLEDAVLYRAGLDQHLDTLASITRRIDATKDSALIEIYLKETVVSRIRFNHEEFQQYYTEHLPDFREPDEYNLRQVLIGSELQADSAVALLSEGADFDYIANLYRQGSKEMAERTQWASLAAFPPSIRGDFEMLSPGQFSKAYPTTDGWLIFKILDRKPGRQKTLEEVDINIREVIFQRKFGQLLDETLAKLKADSEIVMFDEAIENYLGTDK